MSSYTFEEIERMRKALQVFDRIDQYQGNESFYGDSVLRDMSRKLVVEDKLRTYILAGVNPQSLVDAAMYQGKKIFGTYFTDLDAC